MARIRPKTVLLQRCSKVPTGPEPDLEAFGGTELYEQGILDAGLPLLLGTSWAHSTIVSSIRDSAIFRQPEGMVSVTRSSSSTECGVTELLTNLLVGTRMTPSEGSPLGMTP